MSRTNRHIEERKFFEALNKWREGGRNGRHPKVPVWMKKYLWRLEDDYMDAIAKYKKKKGANTNDYQDHLATGD